MRWTSTSVVCVRAYSLMVDCLGSSPPCPVGATGFCPLDKPTDSVARHAATAEGPLSYDSAWRAGIGIVASSGMSESERSNA